jgi:glutathionylspermidine synthase
MRAIEPAWKMLLSNKGILPVLWELFEGHENLLPASFEQGNFRDNYVVKPMLSREGENVSVHMNGNVHAVDGSYGNKGMIWQKLAPIPCIDGNFPVIGSWVIAGESAGIGIREDRNLVTTNASRFIPHYFS